MFRRYVPHFASIITFGGIVLASVTANAGGVATFDGLPYATDPDNPPSQLSYENGEHLPGAVTVPGMYGPEQQATFTSGGIGFVNNFSYGLWHGFAYSKDTDIVNAFPNQYSANTGMGHGGPGDSYGVAFGYDDVTPNFFDPNPFDPTSLTDLMQLPHFMLPAGGLIKGAYITNTTYATQSMLHGDQFAKAFGGVTGNDPDFFLLSAYGIDAQGNVLPVHADFYLADYRFSDNSKDYIITDWTYFDLSALAGAQTIAFNVSSSDAGPYGLNTPGYFAIDDLSFTTAVTVPEPGSLALLLMGGIGLAFGRSVRSKSKSALGIS